MSLFKETITRYVDADGKRCTKSSPGARKVRSNSTAWYGRYVDSDDIRREKRLCNDKTAAQQQLNQLILKAERAKVGIEDRFEEHHQRLLSEHIDDFRKHLEAKGNTSTHIDTTVQRVEVIADGCKFGEFEISRLQPYRTGLRIVGMPMARKMTRENLSASASRPAITI